jgi:prepilin-type processing-associated H-X9-DG protein
MRRHIAAATLVLALLCGSVYGQDADVGGLLPRRTIAYLKVTDVPSMLASFRKSGLKDKALKMLGEDAAQLTAIVDPIEKSVEYINALHLSVHNIAVTYRSLIVDAVAVIELKKAMKLQEFLPEQVMKRLEPTAPRKGAPIFVINIPVDRRIVVRVFIAAVGDRVYAATDGDLLEGVLDAAANGRKRSLASNPDFVRLVRGEHAAKTQLFISPPWLLSMARMSMSRYELREFDIIGAAFGLHGLEAAALTVEPDQRAIRLTVLGDQTTRLFKVFNQPAKPRTVAAHIPETALFGVVHNVGDGVKTYDQVLRRIKSMVMKMGEARDTAEFDRELGQAQAETGLDFRKAAALIEEVGVFMDTKLSENTICVLVKVNDEKKAKEMMSTILAGQLARRAGYGRGNVQRTSYEHLGETIHSIPGFFHWAVVNGYMYAAVDKTVLERAIKAQMLAKLGMPANGKALSGTKGYQTLDKALPAKTSAFAFMNIGKIAAVARMPQEWKKKVVELAKDLMLGAGVQIKGDMIEIVVSANRDISLAEVAEMLSDEAMKSSRENAMKVCSAANLSQIGKANLMFLNTLGKNSAYPPSLKSLVDVGIIQEKKVFLHPSNKQKVAAGKFVTDYASILDLVGRKTAESEMPSSMPLAWEAKSFYKDGGRNVVFFDAHVEYQPTAKFARTMKRVQAAVKKYRAKKPGGSTTKPPIRKLPPRKIPRPMPMPAPEF